MTDGYRRLSGWAGASLLGFAVAIGVWSRFAGLGKSALSVDEYFFVRSIDDVLRTGLPAFDCGGLYMRGLAQQYASAVLRLIGFSPELAPRLISAVGSLVALAGAWVLARRSFGRALAVLAVTLLALSVWEIEMARFARMYAPFQAWFLWYAVYFLQYTADRRDRALWPMVLLGGLSPLLWEGGVLLCVSSLAAVFYRNAGQWPGKTDLRRMIGMLALLALAAVLVFHDFRGANSLAWPQGFVPREVAVSADISSGPTLLAPLQANRLYLLGWSVLLLLCSARGWLDILRPGLLPLQRVTLGATLCAALAHQLLLSAAIFAFALLYRIVTRTTLRDRRGVLLSCALIGGLWVALAWVNAAPLAGTGFSAVQLEQLAHPLVGFPDLVGIVIRPWAWDAPAWGAILLLLLLAGAGWAALGREVPERFRALSALVVLLLLGAAASDTPRAETRYVFFLYPLVLILGLATLQRLLSVVIKHRTACNGALFAVAITGFAFTEDFQPRHLAAIDRPAALYRTDFTPGMQAHVEIRNDLRALAGWLRQQVNPNDQVIVAAHGVDYYFPAAAFFVDDANVDFPQYSCQYGTVDRWSNLPLLHTSAALLTAANSIAGTTYIVVSRYDLEDFTRGFAADGFIDVWRDDQLTIFAYRRN